MKKPYLPSLPAPTEPAKPERIARKVTTTGSIEINCLTLAKVIENLAALGVTSHELVSFSAYSGYDDGNPTIEADYRLCTEHVYTDDEWAAVQAQYEVALRDYRLCVETLAQRAKQHEIDMARYNEWQEGEQRRVDLKELNRLLTKYPNALNKAIS